MESSQPSLWDEESKSPQHFLGSRPVVSSQTVSHLDRSDLRGMVRPSDPDTSYAAARRAVPHLSQTKLRVIACLEEHGDLTDEQISGFTGLKENSASKRRGDLVSDGLVVYAGYERKTSTGRDARVWRLA